MSYDPKRRPATTAAPIHDAAASATTALPPDLSGAMSKAEVLLEHRRESMRRLAVFSTEIPALLREMSAAKPGPELDGVRQRREQASRDRHELIRQLRDEEPELLSVRQGVEQSRVAYSETLVSTFQKKYTDAVSAFQAVLAEGAQLSVCLRTPVDMPLPVAVAWPTPPPAEERAVWWRSDIDPDKVPAVTPVLGVAVHPPDSAAVRIGHSLDGLESAIRFCEAIRNYERRAIDLAARRYAETTSFNPAGVFAVVKPMTDSLIGSQYMPGELVDSSLIPVGMLLRAFLGRCIRPAGSEPASAPVAISPPVASLPFTSPDVPVVEA